MKRPLRVDDVIPALSQWGLSLSGQAGSIKVVPGGLSGAKIWFISQGGQGFCLRRWPSHHPTPDQLRIIHLGIEHVWQTGVHIVPVPRKTLRGDSFVAHVDHLWELTPWLAGEPFQALKSNPPQCTAAVDALARVHKSAKNFCPVGRNPFGPAPGLLHRRERLAELLQRDLAELSQAVHHASPSRLREISLQLLTQVEHALPETFTLVEKYSKVPLPLQWCLRDVHPGNLLFTGNVVTGIVDFGAASFDSVAGDIARLVGGFNCDSRERQLYLKVYAHLCPLTDSERRAISAFHAGGLILSAANWIRWLIIKRSVPLTNNTQARLVELIGQFSRLDCWL